jgi:hypothetical protein
VFITSRPEFCPTKVSVKVGEVELSDLSNAKCPSWAEMRCKDMNLFPSEQKKS